GAEGDGRVDGATIPAGYGGDRRADERREYLTAWPLPSMELHDQAARSRLVELELIPGRRLNVGKQPLRIDILLLQKIQGEPPAEARRMLAGLVEYLGELTL